MPETIELLSFQTTKPCPVKLIELGGSGRWGLCVMELLSILTGEDSENGRPFDSPESVHCTLRLIAQGANDVSTGDDIVRADALWPIIPALMDTAKYNDLLPEEFKVYRDVRFPTKRFAEALGMTYYGFLTPGSIVEQYLRDREYDFDKGVFLLKTALTIFWDEVAKAFAALLADPNSEIPNLPFEPQTDFTDEQIIRLDEYLAHLKNGSLFPTTVGVQGYDSSKTLRA